MKKVGIFILFLLIPFFITAHKDRVMRPVIYEFQYFSGKVEKCDAITDFQKVLRINHACFEHVGFLKKVNIHFRNGEVLTFRYDSLKLDSITLRIDSIKLIVPPEYLNEFRGIHFSSVLLSWSGTYSSPIKSNYQQIIFNAGNGSFFEEFKTIFILFRNNVLAEFWTREPELPEFWHTLELD